MGSDVVLRLTPDGLDDLSVLRRALGREFGNPAHAGDASYGHQRLGSEVVCQFDPYIIDGVEPAPPQALQK